MITLRQGLRDPHVILLQRLLNEHFARDRTVEGLDEDCIFGRRTEHVLRHFQQVYAGPLGALPVNGVADGRVWAALGLRTEISWPLPRVGQTTAMSCWVVAAGLASRSMASRVPDTASYRPVTQPGPNGEPGGGLRTSLPNLENYAADNGMRLLPMMPGSVREFEPHLRRGPAILVGRWTSGGYHAVVVSGYFAGPTEFATMLRINNPSPMGRGSIEVTNYPSLPLEGTAMDPYAVIIA